MYNIAQISDLLNTESNLSDVYTKVEANNLLNSKRNINDSYNQTQVNDFLNLKRNISDSYNQTQVNELVNLRRFISDSYSKTETNNLFNNYYNTGYIDVLIDDYNTKSEVDALTGPEAYTYTTVLQFQDVSNLGINTLSIIGSTNINI